MENLQRHESIISTRSAGRSARRPSWAAGYDGSGGYGNLNEIAVPSPVQNPDGGRIRQIRTLEDMSHNRVQRNISREARRPSLSLGRSMSYSVRRPRGVSQGGTSYDFPENYFNSDGLTTPSPVENPAEEPIYLHRSLEEATGQEQEYKRDRQRRDSLPAEVSKEEQAEPKDEAVHKVSRFATQLYTISYLILFSFLGTLARLGLQTITFYPGAPVVFSELWANFAGSLVMGFLSQDRMLFREEWGTPVYEQQIEKAKHQVQDEESGSATNGVDLAAAKEAYTATKKTIPLYIGLATGFCGCFTSFSSFMRDAFLAMSNELPAPLSHPLDIGGSNSLTVTRNGGYSFMALLAVIITTVCLSIAALHVGAHLAIQLEPWTPTLPFNICRKFLDRLVVILAWGCWFGAIVLAIWPPDRHSGTPEIWRGRAVFALVFAPLGCLGRFYASIYLNSKISSFPLGTFVVNIVGTAIIGMSYDLQHVPLGGVIGCQVLQGIEDGFCGCLTTVSTWVSELSSLRRRNAYRYGVLSIVVAFCFLVVIMGSMQWTRGFSKLQCVH